MNYDLRDRMITIYLFFFILFISLLLLYGSVSFIKDTKHSGDAGNICYAPFL